MPGPKYGEFQFPKAFGFTGSATDSTTIPVRSYERAKPRFAEGGKVSDADRKKMETMTPKPLPKNPVKEPAPTRSLVDIMRGKTRREQEAALGLKKGGRPVKKARGGPVYTKGKEPGHATEQREPEQYNDMDEKSGGRTPVRPYFKKGGLKKAMGGPVKASKGGMNKDRDC